MGTLKDQIISSHISQNYPNARIVNWDDPDSGLIFYTADDLQDVDRDWFPLCANLDPDTGKVVYGGRDRIVHTYTGGETGSGKTTRFAMQSIRALSSMKSKPSFLVVDIHGELVENLYAHLKENGYTVRILNCDDPSRSDTYNPFLTMARRCAASGEIDNQAINEIRKIAEIMQPVESTKDPIWDQGARSYVNGCILDKFEDLIQGLIPPEKITLYNIIENHYWLRAKLQEMSRGLSADLQRIPHYAKKDPQSVSLQKMIGVTNNAEKTTRSYFGVVENHYDAFGQPTLYQLSSSSTIDIEELFKKPTAIFIQSGSTRIADDLLSLMTNEIYNTAVRVGRQSPTKMLPRKIHCFLDEFANSSIADGPEFIRMLTTSRKFGMYWHMLVQCDAQLERKFDSNMAQIIRANCTEIFMGSHDYDTTLRFARSCGQRTVESLGSQIARQNPVLTTVDLVTPDKLSLIPEGWMYIKSNRRPLLYTHIEAFYNCSEFQRAEDIRSVYPVNDFDYRSTYFTPDDIKPPLSEDAFILMRYIHEESPVSIFTLEDVVTKGRATVNAIIKQLTALRYIKEDTDQELVFSEISSQDYYRLARQHPNVPRRSILTELSETEFRVIEMLMDNEKIFVDTLVTAFPTHRVIPMLKKLERLGLLKFDSVGNIVYCAINKEEFSQLCERNPDFCDLSTKDPVYQEIMAQVMSTPGFPELDISALERLTCVPESLLHNVRCVLGQVEYDPEKKLQSLRILKFEIIEAFIAANDFLTKEEWDQGMLRECAQVQELVYLPATVREQFRVAANELTVELTLGNIQEIKKIIQG